MAEHTACPDIFASRAYTAFSPVYKKVLFFYFFRSLFTQLIYFHFQVFFYLFNDKAHKHIFFIFFTDIFFSLLSFSLDNGGETSHQLGNYDGPTD